MEGRGKERGEEGSEGERRGAEGSGGERREWSEGERRGVDGRGGEWMGEEEIHKTEIFRKGNHSVNLILRIPLGKQ